MKFAQSSAVYFNYSLQYAIKDLGQLGYDGIEIWGGRPHMYRNDLDEQLEELNGLLAKNHLKVCNFIPAQFRYPSLLCSDNEHIRKDSIAYIKSAVDNARKVASPSVSLCPGMMPCDHDIKLGWQLLRKSFEELAEYVSDGDVVLLIEPAHKYETNLIYTVEDTLRMIDELKSDKFGVLLDTGHCRINGEDFSQIVPLCKDLPFHIHIDDNTGLNDAHLIPGKGDVDFESLAKALKEIDYSGYISAELSAGYIMDPRAACKESLDVLRQMFDTETFDA